MTRDAGVFPEKVMDLLLDAVCAVDEQGRYVFVNAACERLFGYRREELIGRNMIDLVLPEDRARTLREAQRVMTGEPRLHFENRYVRKDGQVVHIAWSARWLTSERLRVGVARDVTGLTRTQRVQSALYRLSEAAHEAQGLPALCREIHGIVADLLPARSFCVALRDQASGTLSCPYHVENGVELASPRPVPPDSPVAAVIGVGEPLLTRLGGNGASEAGAQGGGRPDWLAAPLRTGRGVIGALVLHTGPGDLCYTEQDRSLLEFVAARVGAAIERKQAEVRILHLAQHDALTDLPNRALFHDRMDVALRRARRDGEHLALLYLDLDDFKQVNDRFGHQCGDQVLREVGHRIGACLRESDTVARMGGDEFTVLLTNIRGPQSVAVVVAKLRAAISVPLEWDGEMLTVTTSIGAAVYPEHGVDKEALFRRADAVMYAGKGPGGERVAVPRGRERSP